LNANDIIRLLKRKTPIIIVIVSIFIIAGTLYSAFIVTPKFQADVRLIVRGNIDENSSEIQTSYYETLFNRQMIKTYCTIIGGNEVYQKIAETLNNGMTIEEISSFIDIRIIPDTVIIEVSVKTENPYLSAAIANMIPEIVRTELIRTMNVDSVEAIAMADVPDKPVEPNMNRNIILAAFLGLAIAVGSILLRELTDQTIKRDTDVREKLGLNVIAMIPNPHKRKKISRDSDTENPVVTKRRVYSVDPGYERGTES